MFVTLAKPREKKIVIAYIEPSVHGNACATTKIILLLPLVDNNDNKEIDKKIRKMTHYSCC